MRSIGLCLAALLAPAAASAAVQSVTETAHYTLADSDSRNDARQICASNAKRTALDRAGSLFEADLTTRKSEAGDRLSDDTKLSMRSTVAAVVGAEVVAETFIVSNDRLAITCMVRLTFDPDEVRKKLADIAGTSDLRQKLAQQQAQLDLLQSQMRTLSLAQRPVTASPTPAPGPPIVKRESEPVPPLSQADPDEEAPLPPAHAAPPWRQQAYNAPPAQPRMVYPSYAPPATYYYYWPGYGYVRRGAYPGWYYAQRW